MEEEKNLNNFVAWAKLKIRIHLLPKKKDFYFKEREIWWASLGVNIGYETDGKNEKFERPILILKVFNGDILWAMPLTSKLKDGKYYYKFSLEDQESVAILSQLRLISSKRLLRKIGMIPESDYENIKETLKSFI